VETIVDQEVTGYGTYDQEQHAVHGKRGVAGVEGEPATERQKHVQHFATSSINKETEQT